MSNVTQDISALEVKIETLRQIERERVEHEQKAEEERLKLNQDYLDKIAAQALLDAQTQSLVAQFEQLYQDKSFLTELQRLLELVREMERLEHNRQKEIAQLLGKLYQLWQQNVIDEKFNSRHHNQVHIPGFVCEKLANLTGLKSVQIQHYLGFIK